MNLTNLNYTFYFESTGEKTKNKYEGEFTVKLALTVGEQIEVAKLTDRFNGGSTTLPPAYNVYNRALAEMEVRVATGLDGKYKAPSWWVDTNGGKGLLDTNVVLDLFTQMVEQSEKEWKTRLDKESEKAEKNKKIDKVEKLDK